MLSSEAQQLVEQYFNLPFKNIKGVKCPYFNNRRRLQRGQLRVLVGKGLPQEIVEETKITSIQYGDEMFDYKGNCQNCGENKVQAIRKYLIDHDLGIDCSGFVVHILKKHLQETKNFDFIDDLFIVPKKNIFRYFISKFRPVENIGVKTLAKNENSKEINKIEDINTGDLVIMLNSGPNNKRDHILLVTDVKDDTISYIHARVWSSEGRYNHGVSKGIIEITNKKEGLLKQKWIEKEKINENNETFLEAKNAKVLKIKRIKNT